MNKFDAPDGEGCARIFAVFALALVCLGVACGVLATVLLNIWL